MMEAVPDADVVVTNPIHLAAALKYEGEKMEAPQIVAKGAGQVAEKIKELARENDVPIVENVPLAQALFRLEVGQIIPIELYQAVAEVLAYVYQLDPKRMAAAAG
jgi:flagellar biosynthetic protein FlhB